MICGRVWIASNRPFPGRVASNPKELDELLGAHKPESPNRIYFPFWSWKVEDDLLLRCECVGFHSAPLPFGRGGSPIQNMIRLGYDYTEVCAFKMKPTFDTGEVLMRHTVSLEGGLGEIIERIKSVISIMIDKMNGVDVIKQNLETWQINELKKNDSIDRNKYFNKVPLKFNRITNNHLRETNTLDQLFDEIRMRDEDGHPKAFLYHGRYVVEFTNAVRHPNENDITANARIYEA